MKAISRDAVMWWLPREGFDCCEDAAEGMRGALRTSERPIAHSVIASIAPLCLRPAGNAPPAAGTRVHRRNNFPFAPALPQARFLHHDAANVATELAALLGNGSRVGVGRSPAENVTPQVASQPVPLTPVRLFFFQGGSLAAHARDATHTDARALILTAS